jgi:hypothetical protein
MRLFEVDNHFANDLALMLRNQMGRSNSKNASLHLTWPAFNNLLKNMHYAPIEGGNPDAMKTFQDMLDSNPELSKIIRTFDKTGVVVDTAKDKPEGGEEVPGGDSVDSMASQASNQFLNNPLS